MKKLIITDYDKLKITKVKYWAIYFEYDGEKYLLHCDGELYEEVTTLYHRIPINNKGFYKLEIVNRYYGNKIPWLKCNYNKHTLSAIDKVEFVYKMKEYGYFDVKLVKTKELLK